MVPFTIHRLRSVGVAAWILLVLAPLPVIASAKTPPPALTPAALTARIDAHLGAPRFAGAEWGISVVSLDSGRTLYSHRADKLMQPASIAKLFTAALSLATLGPDYRIPTRLLATGSLRSGVLDGQLILYGMGDPTLGTSANRDWADHLARQLAARGVRSIKGDLIADDTYFSGPPFGEGWEAGDLQSWFAVPASALSVDENLTSLKIIPAAKPGNAARLSFLAADAAIAVNGSLETTAQGSRSDINLYRAPGSDTLQVFGSLPLNAKAQTFRLALPDPARLAGQRLRQALARAGIHHDGRLRVVHWPAKSALTGQVAPMGEVLSPPVLEILHDGLMRSQNLYLQNLLLASGAREQTDDPDPSPRFASTERYAIRAMDKLLQDLDLPPMASRISEGSGLSRRNLVTPAAMTRLLTYLAAQPYADAVRATLPNAGINGTLSWRMRGTDAEGRVQAKTGNMSYVHSLAGYVTTATGERLAFTIMLNNYVAPAKGPRASADIDAITVMLASFGGRS